MSARSDLKCTSSEHSLSSYICPLVLCEIMACETMASNWPTVHSQNDKKSENIYIYTWWHDIDWRIQNNWEILY